MWIGESVFNFMKRARCCQWCVEMLLVWCEWSTQYSAAQDSTEQYRLDEIKTEQSRAEQIAGVQNRRQQNVAEHCICADTDTRIDTAERGEAAICVEY